MKIMQLNIKHHPCNSSLTAFPKLVQVMQAPNNVWNKQPRQQIRDNSCYDADWPPATSRNPASLKCNAQSRTDEVFHVQVDRKDGGHLIVNRIVIADIIFSFRAAVIDNNSLPHMVIGNTVTTGSKVKDL